MPQEPTECADYTSIDPRYQLTLGGEKFLQVAIAASDGHILIFSTVANMRHLSLAKTWLMDGTFVTAPTNFTQVFSIHGSIHEGVARRFVPLVFMLLPRKNEATYKLAFESLFVIASEMNLDLELSVIKSDFELAQLNASRLVFPRSTLSGCFFHLSQSWYKKLQADGFQQHYGNSVTVHVLFKQITALAFLPPNDIPAAFDDLRDRHAGQLESLFEYISLYYVHGSMVQRKRKPTFPPELWSVYDDVMNNNPRTNNILEGWHNKWRGVFSQGNPPFYVVLKQFQLEERTASAEIFRTLQAEPAQNVPKSKSRKMKNSQIL